MVSLRCEAHAAFDCCWGEDQVFSDVVRSEEGKAAKEAQIDCPEECLNRRAEHGLVHVFDAILDMWDCMDVVC